MYDWEAEQTEPKLRHLAALAATYGITLAELVAPLRFPLEGVTRRKPYRHLLELAMRGLVPDPDDLPDDDETPPPEPAPL